MLELRKITSFNIEEIIALDVAASQKEFMAVTNLRCIADAYAEIQEGNPATAYGIYANDVPVGFLMYVISSGFTSDYFKNEPFYQKSVYFVYNFMIDERYQGKGYGKQALELMLADIETFPHGESELALLFVESKNEVARRLYASLGFIEGIADGSGLFMYKPI